MKLLNLFTRIVVGFDRAKHPFCNWVTANNIRHGKNVFLDLWSEAQHSHDLGDPGPGDIFLAGNLGLVSDLASVKLLFYWHTFWCGRPEAVQVLTV